MTFGATFGRAFAPSFGPRMAAIDSITLPQNLRSAEFTTVEDFEDYTEWTAVVGTPTIEQDTTNYHTGSRAVKMTTVAAGQSSIQKTVNWDLSALKSRLYLWVYVSEYYADPSLTIYLATRADFSQYFQYIIPSALCVGWNGFLIISTDWAAAGGAVWTDPILRIRLRCGTDARSMTFDSLLAGGTTISAVNFEFDDAQTGSYTYAYPYLTANKAVASTWVISDLIGDAGYMTLAQLQALDAAGWTVGNHSKDHAHWSGLTQAEVETSLAACDTALDTLDATRRKHVSYPYGECTQNVLAAMAAQSMLTGRTTVNTTMPTLPFLNAYKLPTRALNPETSLATVEGYVDTAKASGDVLFLYVHNLVDGVPGTGGWNKDDFEDLVDYILANQVYILSRHQLYLLQSGSLTIPRQW